MAEALGALRQVELMLRFPSPRLRGEGASSPKATGRVRGTLVDLSSLRLLSASGAR